MELLQSNNLWMALQCQSKRRGYGTL
uniref:Uncharacterized protein n=1 Tax=Rhizophora mucronata TaxID=61149 RepID=A0A2P2JTB0_RHIMU